MSFANEFKQFTDKVITKLQDATPRATGTSRGNYYANIDSNQAEVLFRGGYFQALVEGRGARRNAGQTNFRENLQRWMAAVGKNATKTESRRLAYLINKYGTRRKQSGNKSDLYYVNFDNEINELLDAIGRQMEDSLSVEIHKAIKK